ncbi:MAG: hypothetical protein KF729_25190 [Sandaracinaceae bacterium]|nr:hypothetical protein [Sandaracinaceae bacterium]
MRAALALSLLLGGCIDTELGLDATIDTACVTVTSANAVSARLDTTYRVGEHAEGDRLFQPNGLELYAGDALVAQMVPDVPPGFVSRVSPGESRSSVVVGEDRMAADPRRLCAGPVRVLLRWLDGSTREIGMADTVTSDVTCE